MDYKHSKTNRVLDLYRRLCEGRVISKSEEAARFGVDARSVQRDLDDIRAYLDERVGEGETRQIIYSRQKKGYLLSGQKSPLMSNSEILAVSKILLESRAFTKEDISAILDKLVSGCVPQKNMKLVTDLLANEKYHYVELTNPEGIQEKLWDLGSDIQQQYLMEITYQRQGRTSSDVRRVIEPVSILFSEYYFYLNAYIDEKNDSGAYVHKHDYPAIFRVDRILDYRLLDTKFKTNYSDRFQEGEFRKRVQFMYPGRLIQLRFRYFGPSVDAILDRLPTARVRSEDETCTEIEAEVYGKGVLMWLLSQGDKVEVLAPQGLREQMKNSLLNALEKYQA